MSLGTNLLLMSILACIAVAQVHLSATHYTHFELAGFYPVLFIYQMKFFKGN